MRTSLFTIVLALLSTAAGAVDGIDLPGRDYASFDAPSAFVCRNTCGGEAECKAYTWVKPGIQGPSGRCWLKNAVPAIVKNPCCNSAPRDYIAKADLKAEGKINRPGQDYNNFETNSWKQCEAACAQEEICASWTHVKPGVQGPSGRCWLKNRVARPVADENTVSGVKFRRPAVRID